MQTINDQIDQLLADAAADGLNVGEQLAAVQEAGLVEFSGPLL